jgi:hypothetical protein
LLRIVQLISKPFFQGKWCQRGRRRKWTRNKTPGCNNKPQTKKVKRVEEFKSIVVVIGIALLAGVAGITVGCKHKDADGQGTAHADKYTCPIHRK